VCDHLVPALAVLAVGGGGRQSTVVTAWHRRDVARWREFSAPEHQSSLICAYLTKICSKFLNCARKSVNTKVGDQRSLYNFYKGWHM
jgi:hypothetical protein